MEFPRARLLLFARAPQPGACKTRLIPRLGAEGAAALAEQLLRRALACALAESLCPLSLCCAPDPDHPLFAELAERWDLSLVPQQGDDLGERMSRAFDAAFTDSSPLVLFGSDVPSFQSAHLRQALKHLEQGADAVLGPVEDGGYWLIGLARPRPELFTDMPWGGAQVAEETRRRLSRLGLHWRELPMLWDLDRPIDLDRLVVEQAWARDWLSRYPLQPPEFDG